MLNQQWQGDPLSNTDDAPLPNVKAREVIRALERADFFVVRSSGSHVHLKKTGHRHIVTVPEHGSVNVKPGTLRAIIRGSGLTKAEFVALLNE